MARDTSDRRRFLARSGVVVGAAWAVPTILSSTPAAAGVPSGVPCAPTVTPLSCSQPFNFTVSVDQLCGPVEIQAVVDEGLPTENIYTCVLTTSRNVVLTESSLSTVTVQIFAAGDCDGTLLDSIPVPFPVC